MTAENHESQGFILKVPNKELDSELESKIMDFYTTDLTIDLSPAILALKEVMNEENSEILKKKLIHFQECFLKILEFCPEMITIKEAETKQGNEDIFHSLINVISLFCRWFIIGTEISYHNEKQCDLIMINKMKKDMPHYRVQISENQ